jgi:hypothetical protein
VSLLDICAALGLLPITQPLPSWTLSSELYIGCSCLHTRLATLRTERDLFADEQRFLGALEPGRSPYRRLDAAKALWIGSESISVMPPRQCITGHSRVSSVSVRQGSCPSRSPLAWRNEREFRREMEQTRMMRGILILESKSLQAGGGRVVLCSTNVWAWSRRMLLYLSAALDVCVHYTVLCPYATLACIQASTRRGPGCCS